MATTNRETTIEPIREDAEKLVDAVWRCVEYAGSAIGEVWLDRAKAIAGVRHILAEHDAKAAVPAGVLKTDREAWLLSELSSMTRLTIGVEQYEELRALANRLARAAVPVGHTNTTEDGQILDVDKLLNVAGRAMLIGRKIEHKLISDLKPVSDSRESGFSGLRYAVADYSFPALISPTKEVLDGRHRIIKARDNGQLLMPTLTLTNEEIQECVVTEKKVPTSSPNAAARAREIVAGTSYTELAEINDELCHLRDVKTIPTELLNRLIRETQKALERVAVAALTASEAEVIERCVEPSCWHCGVVLDDVPKPRCDQCPSECDLEGCNASGCVQSLKGGKDK